VVTWAEDVPVVARHAAGAPGKLYSLVWFDSRDPRASLLQLVSLADQFPSIVIGAKTIFPYLRQHPLQPEFMPLYAFCQERGLPIQFHFGGSPVMEALCHPNLFAVLARAFPRLTIVCLHTDGGWSRELPHLMRHHPNVYVETEYLQLHEAELNVPPQVVPHFLQNWGLTRVMFGSDRVRPEAKYFRRIELVKALPQQVGDALFYRNAQAAYRITAQISGHSSSTNFTSCSLESGDVAGFRGHGCNYCQLPLRRRRVLFPFPGRPALSPMR
jgi:predicted TIM-barrel fold metal-dependent hydrolase